jgi:hypothetical protein
MGEFVPVTNGMGTATVHGESTTMLCMPHVWLFVFDEHWDGDSPLCTSVCTRSHELFMNFFVFHGLPQKSEQYQFPNAMINGVKHAGVQKSMLR